MYMPSSNNVFLNILEGREQISEREHISHGISLLQPIFLRKLARGRANLSEQYFLLHWQHFATQMLSRWYDKNEQKTLQFSIGIKLI